MNEKNVRVTANVALVVALSAFMMAIFHIVIMEPDWPEPTEAPTPVAGDVWVFSPETDPWGVGVVFSETNTVLAVSNGWVKYKRSDGSVRADLQRMFIIGSRKLKGSQ